MTLGRAQIAKAFGSASSANEEGLRRVAFRLAAQTVVLLLVMLIVLEAIVYVITQQTLVGTLEDTLKNRAGQPDFSVCIAFHLPCGRGGPPGPGNPVGGRGRQPGGAPPGSSPQLRTSGATVNPSEASAVFVDRQLHIRHGDGVLSGILLDATGAQKAMRTGREQCCSTDEYRGEEYLVYSAPLLDNGIVVGAVQTSISEHQYRSTMSNLSRALLVVALLGLVISGGISVLLVRRALRPIRAAIQRQRDFVADAAHELRTPLAIMRTVGEVGMAEPSADELQATIAQMLGENQHLTRLVEDLSLLARTDTNAIALDRRPVDLSSLVTETVTELGPLAEAQDVRLRTDVSNGISGVGDLLRLRQLLLILLDNALKHTPAGGTVSVYLSRQGDRARLQVTDSGPGIDPADLPRIFDRFYRADRARTGEGSGLGLAIGKWIAEAHGGHIQAGNGPQRGAVFTVTVPVARAGVPAST